MILELVSFPAADGVVLDGLYYRHDDSDGRRGLILVHGKGGNFYSGLSRSLPPVIIEDKIDCLALNRRGHDIIYTFRRTKESQTGVFEERPYGAAYETYKDTQLDIEGAFRFMRSKGYDDIFLLGHSFGALASACYAASHPVKGVILCSPPIGGEDMMKEGSKRGQSALDRYEELRSQAIRLLREGKGDTLLPLQAWWWTISAYSMIEMHAPVTLECVERISCPILAIRGGKEDPTFYPVDQMPSRAKSRCELVIIPDTDHLYTGKLDVLAATIRRWLASFS